MVEPPCSGVPMLAAAMAGNRNTTTVSFIIPAHNEQLTIRELLERVVALDLPKQVVVVDDGSTDKTAAIAEEFARLHDGVLVLRRDHRGKGAAVRAGISAVTGDVTVIQDADLEYDPDDVPILIGPITRGVADVVYGSRLTGGKPQRAYMFW